MLAKRSLVVLGSVGLLVAAYFIYTYWLRQSTLSVWSFVPEGAIAVYESSNVAGVYRHLEETDTWKVLTAVEGFDGLSQALAALDSTLNESDRSMTLFENTPTVASIHLTSKNTLDALLVLEIRNIRQQNVLNRLQKGYVEGGYRRRTRNYLGFTISEITAPSGQTFTYIFHKNYFIGSKTAYLVEDAIRTLNEASALTFAESNPYLYPLAKLEKDDGNLYLNFRRTEELVRAFSPNQEVPPVASSGFLDIAFENNAIQLDGFVFSPEDGFLNQFQAVEGADFDMAEVVSNNSAILYHYSFTDPNQMATGVSNYKSPRSNAVKSSLIADLDFDVDHTFNLVDQEMAIDIQYVDNEAMRTLLLEVRDAIDAMSFFQSVAERKARQSRDSVFTEKFRSYSIYKLEAPEFPMALLGDHAEGFEETYFVRYRNYIIFSNDLPHLKSQLTDIENDNTWRRSLRKVRFLDKTNQQSGFSYYVHTPALWSQITEDMDPKWERLASENDYIFKSFDNIAFQFNEVDDKFFTSIIADLPEQFVTGSRAIVEERTLTLRYPITTKPFLVRNHDDPGKMEIILQDSARQIHLIDANFDVRWSVEIGGAIVGAIDQLDFYKNGKLQYVFISEDSVHIIDRNGDYLPGFPNEVVGAKALMHFRLIDYDGSRDYRFGISDQSGQVFLTDKNAKPLDGWGPRTFSSPLSYPLRHFKIGGTDVIIVLQQNGQLNMLSRRSRSYPGFPIKTEREITSSYHLKPGSRFNSTSITTITTNGEIISVDLKGKLLKREQLLKPSTDTRFEIINDVTEKSFIILRKTANQYEVLNANGDLLFEKDYLEEEGFFAQYYNLSSSKQYVVIGNPEGHFAYLYDMNGRLVTSRPLRAANPVSMLYAGNKDELQIYTTNDRDLKLIRLN